MASRVMILIRGQVNLAVRRILVRIEAAEQQLSYFAGESLPAVLAECFHLALRDQRRTGDAIERQYAAGANGIGAVTGVEELIDVVSGDGNRSTRPSVTLTVAL